MPELLNDLLEDLCLRSKYGDLGNDYVRHHVEAFTNSHLFLVAIATEEYGGMNAKDFERLSKQGLTNKFLHVFDVIQHILAKNCFVLSRIKFGEKDRLIGMVSAVMITYA